ncbi:hypothetical protein TVAG_461810 [Trichomonas vaginalis G3]|uniref:Uncharacterized protein n=1 Tax=Trichomonas vaginalis (strain ATCC PRA-98 / G3) TaxID=412133 RepID=A2FI55_TRIV3|nr:biological adhesion protein [Trichomonas vaginalis G3]EAX95408.1 hypothetical protein TVAG_461810 [Trichomonas vaginalis G3]KAI5524125.1 biological adhesion protein [Trichomonas vaginalis G3]|eukprot:XP_001308338.1 hypothetical protein [Trichomonas vaginalis G3]
MDSCSQSSMSSGWSASSGSHTKGDLLQIQQMKLQNQHLMQLNAQLQANIDNLNKQLAQALTTAAKVDPLHQQNCELKSQIRELTAKSEKQAKALEKEIESLNTKIDTEREKAEVFSNATNSSMKKNTEERQNLVSEVARLTAELKSTQDQLHTITDRANKLTKQRAKLDQKNKELTTTIGAANDKLAETCQANEEFDTRLKEALAEIDQLNEELANMTAHASDSDQQLALANAKNQNLEETLQTIQEQLQLKTDELTQVSDERNQLYEDNQKLNGQVSNSEEQIQQLTAEKETLTQKVKKLSALTPASFGDVVNFNELALPFNDEIVERIKKIFSYDHFQPTHKVQLLINELSKDLTSFESKTQNATQEQEKLDGEYKKLEARAQKLEELLSSLLTQWKNLEFTQEKINTAAFAIEDKAFLDLIGSNGANCDCINKCAELLGPMFGQFDLFSEDAVERRQQIVNEVCQSDKELGSLLAAIFLINTRLQEQIHSAQEALVHKNEFMKHLEACGVNEIGEITAAFDDLIEKIEHLKMTRKEIHKSLRDARNEINEKNQQQEQLKAELNTANTELQTLQAENAQLKSDLNKLTVEQTKHEQESEVAKKNVEELENLKKKNKQLQEAITEANEENLTLKKAIDDINCNHQQHVVEEKKAESESRTNEALAAKDQEIKQLQQKLEKTKKKARTMIKDMKTQHESEMNAMATELENQKAALTESLQEMTDKAHKAKSESKKVMDQSAENEKKAKALEIEKVKLQKTIKDLESKINNILEQTTKQQATDKKNYQAQLLVAKQDSQKEVNDIKNKLTKEKKEFVDHVKRCLGSIYGISDFSIDDDSIDQLFERARKDVEKLKFFQAEATKF